MQRTLIQAAFLVVATASVAATAAAQGRGNASTGYPPGFRPPAGMCRVWIQGVPPGRQPGVTDCVSARASAPRNSTVIYGDRDDNPTFRRQAGIYSRTVYDANGNRVVQRIQRNANGTLTILSSRPYPTRGNGSVWTDNDANPKHHKDKDKDKDRHGKDKDKGDRDSHDNGNGHHDHV